MRHYDYLDARLHPHVPDLRHYADCFGTGARSAAHRTLLGAL